MIARCSVPAERTVILPVAVGYFVVSPSLQRGEEQCSQFVADQKRCTKENQESNYGENQVRLSLPDHKTVFQNHSGHLPARASARSAVNLSERLLLNHCTN